MISYNEALAIINDNTSPLSPVSYPLDRSLGHVSSKSIISKVSVPPFRNSAMDGFAVQHKKLENAPVTLPVAGYTVAGDNPSSGEGGAWEIMTGAAVPGGYDAVVKVEDVSILEMDMKGRPKSVHFPRPTCAGNNIRSAGEDFGAGDVIAEPGDRITPAHILAMAAAGVGRVDVFPNPKVTVFSTGKEVVSDPDTELLPGQIRDANGPFLMSALRHRGLRPTYAGTFLDEQTVFETYLEKILGCNDVIISTGAVSAGRHDFIPDSLEKLGAEICFHKIAVRPGKPVLYAKFKNGPHYFGLPGNPLSAAIGCRFLVDPLLRIMSCAKPETEIFAVLDQDKDKHKDLRFFQKAFAYQGDDGRLNVQILNGQESFKIHPLLKANCWAVLPEGTNHIKRGDKVVIAGLQSCDPLL